MSANFVQTTAQSDLIQPLANLNPAVANVAALPAAASYAGRFVLLAASTAPGGACLAISDGTNWYPILIGGDGYQLRLAKG